MPRIVYKENGRKDEDYCGVCYDVVMSSMKHDGLINTTDSIEVVGGTNICDGCGKTFSDGALIKIKENR